MKRHVTTLAITISAESPKDRDFLAQTIADNLNARPDVVQHRGLVIAKVTRAQVKRSRPVRRAK